MSGPLSTFALPRAAPAAKKRGSLPPLPPPPVRRADAPGEAGDTQADALWRFTAEDSGNPCQPTSNADFQVKPRPQRRGLRPPIVQFCGCQTRAPPTCATHRLKGGHPYDGTALTPGGGNRRSIHDPWALGFPAPIGGFSLRRRRCSHGVRPCPNRHQRWIAGAPPLLSFPLPGLGLSRIGEGAGCGRDVAGPMRPQIL